MTTILTFLLIWTAVSIVLGLIIAAVMRFGLHYEPPNHLPPLPEGSILGKHPRVVS